MKPEVDLVRFRCPDCSRGLRVPEAVIGKRLVCPFCRSIFDSSFAGIVPKDVALLPLPHESPADTNASTLTRWMPTKKTFTDAATKVARSVRDGADAGASAVVSAANSTVAAVSSTAKKAVAAATPLTQVVTGLASVVVPGAGEVMSGKTTQGFCTLAAYIGVSAIATTATGGAWIAAPLAVSVFSAVQGVRAGRQLGKTMRGSIESSNTEEIEAIARQMREQAASMGEEEFERLMLEREEAEMNRADADPPKRQVVLVRVTTSPKPD